MDDTPHDRMPPPRPARPYVLINSFTPKAGKLDELADLLERSRNRFADNVRGFHGGRVYRDVDGSSALFISVFETEAHYVDWLASRTFADYQANVHALTDGMGQSRVEAGLPRRREPHGSFESSDRASTS